MKACPQIPSRSYHEKSKRKGEGKVKVSTVKGKPCPLPFTPSSATAGRTAGAKNDR